MIVKLEPMSLHITISHFMIQLAQIVILIHQQLYRGSLLVAVQAHVIKLAPHVANDNT